tara:strand:+ start:759 stop:1133 length:375 start_codon:yes stop_codon:yes gene_type:complete
LPATTSIQLLATTAFGSSSGNYDGSSATFNSDKVKGDGYYGFSDGVHTVQSRVTNLIGTIKIQGTLVKDPADTDFVDIVTVNESDGSTAITNSFFNNFTGNFVWIRIAVSGFTAGSINSIYMAH